MSIRFILQKYFVAGRIPRRSAIIFIICAFFLIISGMLFFFFRKDNPVSIAYAPSSDISFYNGLLAIDDNTYGIYWQEDGEADQKLKFKDGFGRYITGAKYDKENNSLWATFDFPKNDAIYNIDLRTGRTINRFNAKKFDKNIKEIEGIAVDNTDDALWVVDDEAGKIYQITKSGNLKKFVDLKNISPEPESPESIAYDEPADTLWIAENRNNRVYNISKKGELLSYFSVSKLGITNLQGVELDNGGNLLLTARGKSKIYKVTKRGELLSAYEGFSDNFIDIAQAPLSENFNAKKITEISSVEPSGDDFSFGVIGDPEINTKSNEIFEGHKI